MYSITFYLIKFLFSLFLPPFSCFFELSLIVKKFMLMTDSDLKKIQLEKEVEEPLTLTTTADYRPIPLRQPTLPGSAKLKDPTGQVAKKDHSKLAPVKISKGDPVYSEKFTNSTAYAKRMHDVLYPRTRTTEELDKAYSALEEAKKKARVGILGSDEAHKRVLVRDTLERKLISSSSFIWSRTS
jgi:hypothetical protein